MTTPTTHELRDALEDILDESYQTEFPVAATAEVPAWLTDFMSSFGDIGRVALTAIAIIVVGLVVLWAFRRLRDRPPSLDARTPDESAPAGAESFAHTAADADALAASGNYAAAIHTLLLSTLAQLVRLSTTALPDSLTSREICARVPMPEAPRSALWDLVRAVELTHFGRQIPDGDDYTRCRHAFDEFALAHDAAAS